MKWMSQQAMGCFLSSVACWPGWSLMVLTDCPAAFPLVSTSVANNGKRTSHMPLIGLPRTSVGRGASNHTLRFRSPRDGGLSHEASPGPRWGETSSTTQHNLGCRNQVSPLFSRVSFHSARLGIRPTRHILS
ncbi:hypothetical protein B0H67DRAFT_334005 [Lasiosphaeris hirsuta]|uniref:Secreted protein n=1 Tax=Lasiosphaeris hirsuta TaxID=260670 RepID=A0AA40A2T1_9PEZI|nr:hypothetical protein B0H67DRAFT_334005 [Lasiosphaeris hirsuta]